MSISQPVCQTCVGLVSTLQQMTTSGQHIQAWALHTCKLSGYTAPFCSKYKPFSHSIRAGLMGTHLPRNEWQKVNDNCGWMSDVPSVKAPTGVEKQGFSDPQCWGRGTRKGREGGRDQMAWDDTDIAMAFIRDNFWGVLRQS